MRMCIWMVSTESASDASRTRSSVEPWAGRPVRAQAECQVGVKRVVREYVTRQPWRLASAPRYGLGRLGALGCCAQCAIRLAMCSAVCLQSQH